MVRKRSKSHRTAEKDITFSLYTVQGVQDTDSLTGRQSRGATRGAGVPGPLPD